MIDFAQAAGSVCGYFQGYGTTASEYARATSIIGEDLGGKGGGGGGSTAAASSAAAKSTEAAGSGSAAAAKPTSTNAAAVPTAGYGIAGLLGGAAALAGVLI